MLRSLLIINLKDIPKNLYAAALVVAISVVGFMHPSVSSGDSGATPPFSFLVAEPPSSRHSILNCLIKCKRTLVNIDVGALLGTIDSVRPLRSIVSTRRTTSESVSHASRNPLTHRSASICLPTYYA